MKKAKCKKCGTEINSETRSPKFMICRKCVFGKNVQPKKKHQKLPLPKSEQDYQNTLIGIIIVTIVGGFFWGWLYTFFILLIVWITWGIHKIKTKNK